MLLMQVHVIGAALSVLSVPLALVLLVLSMLEARAFLFEISGQM